VKNLFIQL
jgi:hypothetical protein